MLTLMLTLFAFGIGNAAQGQGPAGGVGPLIVGGAGSTGATGPSGCHRNQWNYWDERREGSTSQVIISSERIFTPGLHTSGMGTGTGVGTVQ